MKYIDVIPSKESVSRGESLNLLGGAANDGGAVTLDIAVWGRTDGDWQALVTRRTEVLANEHKHLYFTLSPECFSAERWGEEIEEIELRIDDQKPGPQAMGRIVFVE